MVKRDKLWKAILESRFRDFLLFFFGDYENTIDWERPFEFLDKELLEITLASAMSERYVDKLVKVWGEPRWILVHIEVQGKKDSELPQRMFTYFYRALDRYNVDITALAILNRMHRIYSCF